MGLENPPLLNSTIPKSLGHAARFKRNIITFSVTANVKVTKDEQDVVRKLHHPRQPYQPEDSSGAATNALDETSLRQVADAYVKEVLPLYALNDSLADNLTGAIRETDTVEEGPKLRFVETGKSGKLATVAYTQTVLGIPVWQTGMTVKALRTPIGVIGSQSSVQEDIDVDEPSWNAPYLPDQLDATKLADLLGLDDIQRPTINGIRLLIYQLDANDRGDGVGEPALDDETIPDDETYMHVCCPTLQLPELPSELVSGRFYVVSEVLFSLTLPGTGSNNWGAFIEPKTGSALRVDVFVGCVDGYVYLRDPLTKTGDMAIQAHSQTTVLNNLRDRVSLDALLLSNPQNLLSDFVHVRNVSPPNTSPPMQPGGSDFLYSVPTDNFSAVNAFYHCDRLFRMIEDMGFDVSCYFDGTTFPVPVDHRVCYGNPPTPNIVNASAPGNAHRKGSDGFRFALLQQNTNVGMAVNWRVTLHEFGHAILWDHIRSPNFRFAHSAGDSLAAILNNPESQAPDRFRTFPWTIIQRRHDRPVVNGWGWGGHMDNPSIDWAGYDREQILSTTLFRYYRAIGGDHSDDAVRHQASRYVVFIIYSAVGVLTFVRPPRNAADFAEELMDADEVTNEFEGLPGGMTHKVIRWAFERQGLYQPPAAPTPTIQPGAPPDVDVYIDDGRGGGYDPQSFFVFTSNDIWNRNALDSALKHQQPLQGKPNFLYVRVKNRGTLDAPNVVVKAFISIALGEREWPSQWSALGTESANGPIAPQGETIVGPFLWKHTEREVVALLASVSADGDMSNAESVTRSVPVARLTHYDNNIAGRIMMVSTVPSPETSTIKVHSSPNLSIPDADPAGVVAELSVTTSGTVAQVEVRVNIQHTSVRDLMLSLTSPAQTTVVLDEGWRDDASDNLVETFTPQTVNDLNIFENEDVVGTWKLRVIDHVGLDTGTILRWELSIEVSS